MLKLRIGAPFAAFRRFSAGAFRPTAVVPTPTALYGLVLNVAGIESRREDGASPMTVTAPGLPSCRLAMGFISMPTVTTLVQQLHNYPVGTQGRDRAADTRGAKYNIQPVRREFLVGVDLRLWVDGNPALEERARRGLQEGTSIVDATRRYGLPFLGDNNLLLSHLHQEAEEPDARWLLQAPDNLDQADTGEELLRLPTWIDRMDMTKTRTALFLLDGTTCADPPDDAWISIEPPSV